MRMDKDELEAQVFEELFREPKGSFSSFQVRLEHKCDGRFNWQDRLTLNEILWEFLVQGILAPGDDPGRDPDLPSFHVTEYGMRCLREREFCPYDPQGYIDRLQGLAQGRGLDEIILVYVRESLTTFRMGCYFASAVMLGVAAEQCVDMLIAAYRNSVEDETKRRKIEKISDRPVSQRFEFIRRELPNTGLTRELKDALDIRLSGIFTLIRCARNEAGHPATEPVDRNAAYINLQLFPKFCERVYQLLQHLRGVSAEWSD